MPWVFFLLFPFLYSLSKSKRRLAYQKRNFPFASSTQFPNPASIQHPADAIRFLCGKNYRKLAGEAGNCQAMRPVSCRQSNSIQDAKEKRQDSGLSGSNSNSNICNSNNCNCNISATDTKSHFLIAKLTHTGAFKPSSKSRLM